MSDDLVRRIARIIEAEEGAYVKRGPLWAEVAARKAIVVAGEPYADRIAALEAERDQVRRDFDATWAVDIPFHQEKYLTERARADRLEAEVARLREVLQGEPTRSR